MVADLTETQEDFEKVAVASGTLFAILIINEDAFGFGPVTISASAIMCRNYIRQIFDNYTACVVEGMTVCFLKEAKHKIDGSTERKKIIRRSSHII